MDQEAKSFGDQLYVAGKDLVETLKRLIDEGNVRSVVLWSESGKKLMEIPLTTGVAVGGAAIILAPLLVALGAIAATVKKVRIEVIRHDPPPR